MRTVSSSPEAAEAALERTTTQVAGVLRCAAFASAHRILLPRAIAPRPAVAAMLDALSER